MPELAKIPDLLEGSTIHKDLTPKSNGPDKSSWLFMVGEQERLQAEVKAAQKKLKTHNQFMTNRGVDLEETKEALAERERRDKTTLQKLQKRCMYMEYLGLPIARQIKLFDEPDNEPTSAHSDKTLIDRAGDEGFELGISGKNPDEQKYPPFTPEGQAHLARWNEGQDVHKAKFLEMNEEKAREEAAKAKERADKDAAKAKAAEEKAAKATRKVAPDEESETGSE
jgi:hypothetical protein